MRLYQSNFEDNTASGALGTLVLYSFLFIIPNDDITHRSIGDFAIAAISLLTFSKLYLIYFNKNKNYERYAAFILLEATAMFWAYIYVSEIVHSAYLNNFIFITFLILTGVAYVTAFALYKNPLLNYLFCGTVLLLPAVITYFYLDELKLLFILIFILSFSFIVIFSRMHHKNWQEFLAEKDRSVSYSQALVKTNFKLKKALEAAESATLMKTDFIATVSHEIRTPMNGILGMSSLLHETKLNEEQEEFLGMIESSADSLLTIINDILDFSKLESGKLRIENVSFDLSSLLNEIGVIFGELASGKGLEFNLDVSDSFDINVIGDPVRLRQILTNIIGNALKFTVKGYIELTVKIKPIDADIRMVQFRIEDSGIGIEKEKIKTIFDRFTQADASTTRKFGGTGLGLAITKELVELMKGYIDIESKSGVGTVLDINIPFKIDSFQLDKVKVLEVDEILDSLKKLTKGKKILVVEDNIINQKVASLMLQKTGCIIETAINGQEAVDMINKTKYDLVLMDIHMPVLSGVEATAKIRALQQNDNYTTIIAMTADAMKGDREKYISAGMDDYISKPIKQDILFDVLSRWLIKT